MNKKYIIGGLVIVLAVFAGFFFGRKSAVAPSATDFATSTNMIVGTTTTITSPVPRPAPRPQSSTATKPSSAPSTPAMTANGSYLVMYTNSGFSPATLTIKKGQSVHFVNYSSKAMSLTAIDQNSQIYRNFNQEQSVGRGGYFDFSFVIAGNWGYLNRNNQADRGTIVVE